MLGRRSDEGDVVLFENLSEAGILGQEAIARMHGVGAGDFAGGDNRGNIEIAVLGRRRADAHALIGEPNMHGVGVGRRVHRNGGDAKLLASAFDSEGDLSPVGDQDLVEHRAFNWCIGAGAQYVSQEAISRGGPLMDCSAGRSYADEAVNSARINIDRGCGFTGPRWTAEPQAHFGWGMKFRGGPTTSEANARRADLAGCRREFPKATIPPPKSGSCPSNMFLGKDGTCYPIL